MRLLLKFRRYFYNLGGFSKILGISSGNLEDSSAATWLTRARHPRSQRHPQRFFRPQINTDWHRLRAKALSESPGNHRYRLTSVYQPERVTQGTCPCDTFPNLVKCKKQLLTTLRLLFLHYSNTFITFAPKKIQYNYKQRRSTAFS